MIPALVSYFSYFIFDFGRKKPEVDDDETLNTMGKVIIYGVPIVWIFVAFNIDLNLYLF